MCKCFFKAITKIMLFLESKMKRKTVYRAESVSFEI